MVDVMITANLLPEMHAALAAILYAERSLTELRYDQPAHRPGLEVVPEGDDDDDCCPPEVTLREIERCALHGAVSLGIAAGDMAAAAAGLRLTASEVKAWAAWTAAEGVRQARAAFDAAVLEPYDAADKLGAALALAVAAGALIGQGHHVAGHADNMRLDAIALLQARLVRG